MLLAPCLVSSGISFCLDQNSICRVCCFAARTCLDAEALRNEGCEGQRMQMNGDEWVIRRKTLLYHLEVECAILCWKKFHVYCLLDTRLPIKSLPSLGAMYRTPYFLRSRDDPSGLITDHCLGFSHCSSPRRRTGPVADRSRVGRDVVVT